jgi:riboflavin synthase
VFTGIVRERGRVTAVDESAEGIRLTIDAAETAAQAEIGDSVALNGVCLTVTNATDGTLAFDAVPETLARTSLGDLAAGDEVNIEPALRAGEPIGGHYVQGHVDVVARVRSTDRAQDGGVRAWFDAGAEILRYVVEKGSITVDGVALTVVALDDTGFAVALVPHTLAVTTLANLHAGDSVNVEVDVLAKYVEKLVRAT